MVKPLTRIVVDPRITTKLGMSPPVSERFLEKSMLMMCKYGK